MNNMKTYDDNQHPVIALGMMILAPIAAILIQLAVSRQAYGGGAAKLFSTHPPRVARLEAMAMGD